MKTSDIHCAYDKLVDIEQVVPNPRNPNTHPDRQIEMLVQIIAAQGWRAPISVSRRSGFVVRGHGRLMAAHKLGSKKVPVDYQDYESEAQEWADLIADNRIAELAEIDNPSLTDLLAELDPGNIELTGYTEEELEKLLARSAQSAGEDDFDLEETLEDIVPATRLGDIWQLGRHRVMCGDATNPGDVERLMAGAVADGLVTDPPYGVNYAAKNEFLNRFDRGNRNQTPITADEGRDYRTFFGAFLSLAPLGPRNTAYVFISGKELHSLRLAFSDSGYSSSTYLVWVKNHFVLSRQDYNARHEFILYGWKGSHRFYGDASASTILEFDRPYRSIEHPTMKPVPLIARLIDDGTRSKGKVYDPFLGSGTTLIAAEQLGRTCFGIEIDPIYCDVIVRRWEEFTGRKGELL